MHAKRAFCFSRTAPAHATRGGPCTGPRRVRPAEAAFRAHLGKPGGTCDKGGINGWNGEISPSFLQDLHSKVIYLEVERRY